MSKYNFYFFLSDKNMGSNHRMRKLSFEIRKHPSNAPFIEGDMAKLLQEMFTLKYFKDDQIKEMITELVSYFGKGNAQEIYDIIKQK